MKEYDFVFITSPTNARNPHPPYYFMSLASYLRNKGCSVLIIDPKGKDKPQDLKAHIEAIRGLLSGIRAKFIGLAAFHSDYPMIMQLAKMIRENDRESILLVGNAHATINPEDFIYKNSPFDIAVLGEGEETCYELYQLWERQDRFSEVKGIAYWERYSSCGCEKLVKTEKRSFMDLAEMAIPAYDLIDMHYYLKPTKLIIRRIYTSMVCIFSGRGCPFDCDFCAANVVWKANKGKPARLRPVENVIEEIRYLHKRYRLDFFYLFDDMFGMKKSWMNEWFKRKVNLDEYLAMYDGYLLKEIKYPYACQTRADIATEEMIRGLKETGCIQVDIGVESGSQKLLDNVNKKITLDQIRQVMEWCRKYKIRSFATMLLNLPGETKEDLNLTYKFLEEVKPSAGVIFGVTTPYPGTQIYNFYSQPLLKEEYGLLINNRLVPSDRFRMSEHKENLWKLLDKWNLHFKVHPMFERMWPVKPFQKLYFKTVLRSKRKFQYIKCWAKDLTKSFSLYWLHKTNLYLLVKKIQYGDKWK